MSKRGTLNTAEICAAVKKAKSKGQSVNSLAKALGVSNAAIYYHVQKADGTLPASAYQSKKQGVSRRKPKLPVMIEIPVVDEPTIPLTAFVGNVSSVTQAVKEMLNAN